MTAAPYGAPDIKMGPVRPGQTLPHANAVPYARHGFELYQKLAVYKVLQATPCSTDNGPLPKTAPPLTARKILFAKTIPP